MNFNQVKGSFTCISGLVRCTSFGNQSVSKFLLHESLTKKATYGTYSVLRVYHQAGLRFSPNVSPQNSHSYLIRSFHHQSRLKDAHKCMEDHLSLHGRQRILHSQVNLVSSVRYVHEEKRSSRRQLKSNKDNDMKNTNNNNPDDIAKEFLEKEAEKPKKLTLGQRFKKTYKEHGKVLIGVHIATSVMWYASFYLAARQGVNVIPLLEWLNVSESIINQLRGNAGDIATTILMVKIATPLRYSATIGGTLGVIKYLRKEGKMEPVAAEDTLSSMYKEGSANIKKNIRHKSRLSQIRMRRKYDKKVTDMKNKVSVMKNRLKHKAKRKK